MPIAGALVLLIELCLTRRRAPRPAAGLKQRAEELATCGSLDERLALAAECMERRMLGEAAKLYESCLAGAYAADGPILFSLARCAVERGDWQRGAGAIARLRAAAPQPRPLELRLLEARIHEARGEYDAALAAYREILPRFAGLEARHRYGRLLLRLGRREAA